MSVNEKKRGGVSLKPNFWIEGIRASTGLDIAFSLAILFPPLNPCDLCLCNFQLQPTHPIPYTNTMAKIFALLVAFAASAQAFGEYPACNI